MKSKKEKEKVSHVRVRHYGVEINESSPSYLVQGH